MFAKVCCFDVESIKKMDCEIVWVLVEKKPKFILFPSDGLKELNSSHTSVKDEIHSS